MSKSDVFLAIDVGTGSIRSALVDCRGAILKITANQHDQIVTRSGWAEQRPHEWWRGVVSTVRRVLDELPNARSRIRAVCVCGQMHGTVLLTRNGDITLPSVPLWNDKRTVELVTEFERTHKFSDYASLAGNPPTPAWPGFKLQWLKANEPEAYSAASLVLMPKDYVNFRLTGQAATDWSEASCSFLMDWDRRIWSDRMISCLGLDGSLMPPIRAPGEILGGVGREAAVETGLPEGIPVLVGAADFAMALLGSGACRPGVGSEVMGTSSIATAISRSPIINEALCNMATVEGNWATFSLLESGGDAMRWARRVFHDSAMDYKQITALAEGVPPGSNALFFLPYLTGERLGRHRNARSQFFGITALHRRAHLHRAVLEGVGFAIARQIREMEAAIGSRLDCIVASGGGAKAEIWLQIKASIYGVPILVPREEECSIIGCAALAATSVGHFPKLEAAINHFVTFDRRIEPNPAWQDVYGRMQPIFDRLYVSGQNFYDDLDALEQSNALARAAAKESPHD